MKGWWRSRRRVSIRMQGVNAKRERVKYKRERERERWDGMSLACFSGDCRKRREEGREENER